MKNVISTNRREVVLLLLSISGHATISKSVSKFHRLCQSDFNTLCQDVVGSAQVVEPPSTPFEDLNRLSHGQEEEHYYIPGALNYGVPKDMCMWQAFFNNEIKSEECSAALRAGMENVQKKHSHFHCPNLMLLHIFALTFAWSYYSYATNSPGMGISPRFRTAVVFGPLLVSFLYIRVAYPFVSITTLAGAGLIACFVLLIQAVLDVVFLITMMLFTPSEDEEEKQQRCDSEDGYRRMVDNETALYVAVPLQVV